MCTRELKLGHTNACSRNIQRVTVQSDSSYQERGQLYLQDVIYFGTWKNNHLRREGSIVTAMSARRLIKVNVNIMVYCPRSLTVMDSSKIGTAVLRR